MHIIGLPPVARCSRVRVGPGQRGAQPGLGDALQGADGHRPDHEPFAGQPQVGVDGVVRPPVRHEVSSRTGSSTSRRRAKVRTLRVLTSSHCTSSIGQDQRRRAAERPQHLQHRDADDPAAARARPARPRRASAACSARCCTVGQGRDHVVRQRPRAGRRARRTPTPPPTRCTGRPVRPGRWLSAAAVASAQMAVLPMPAEPSSTSDSGPAAASARKRATAASSLSRPTMGRRVRRTTTSSWLIGEPYLTFAWFHRCPVRRRCLAFPSAHRTRPDQRGTR